MGKGAGEGGAEGELRRRLDVKGRVQGVGFRPFVWRLATDCGLSGRVGNDASGVFVEVEGPREAVERFTTRLPAELPDLARISELVTADGPCLGDDTFRIEKSVAGGERAVEVTPDTASCADCLREMLDPGDRRHRYPFINCTNCGPRYTIIQGVPYDRPLTTMKAFPMCAACRAEYEDPADRRFHAQPNACPDCGPRIWLCGADGIEVPGDGLTMAARRLQEGEILAIKGLGGFHLACRADDDEAVTRLRRRKNRESKALALMVPDLETARRLVEVDGAVEEALCSPERPIVLAPKKRGGPVAASVAPGTGCLGLMLPYTPLHVLLFAEGLGPLVMTSGNPSAEPLCRDNDEALKRLGEVCDAFLLHDRDIERRVDDSVVVALPAEADGKACRMIPVRRARGFAPAPLKSPVFSEKTILAVGGELKSAVCLLWKDTALMSEHLGELENPAAFRNFVQTVERFEELFGRRPEIVAHDLHPGYGSTRFARGLDLPATAVQHHHAHAVAVMAEHGLCEPVIAVTCDGTGYGGPGEVWGGEILVAELDRFRRLACLRPFPLRGSDAAVREPWRPARAWLRQSLGADALPHHEELFATVDPRALAMADTLLARPGLVTSSCGRLFDAVAFLLGLVRENHHEAQGPMALEACATEAPPGASASPSFLFPSSLSPSSPSSSPPPPLFLLDTAPMARALVEGLQQGYGVAELARFFHESLAALLAAGALEAASREGIDTIVLSGGCFLNRLLTESLIRRLRDGGKVVYVHEQVPTGDGGIALGQAVCAAARLRKGSL